MNKLNSMNAVFLHIDVFFSINVTHEIGDHLHQMSLMEWGMSSVTAVLMATFLVGNSIQASTSDITFINFLKHTREAF